MKNTDLKALLKRVVELVMPDLRSYYRVTRKARVVKAYAPDGQYWADVQPLKNDESKDPSEPVIAKVEIPILWAGPNRGVVCPPQEGSYCDLSYYDGDPNYPRISNFRWHGNSAPACETGAFIIARGAGTYITIDPQNNIIHVTPADKQSEIGANKAEEIGGNADINTGGSWTVIAGVAVTLQAPTINIVGNISSTGEGGGIGTSEEKSHKTHEGSYTLTGDFTMTGNLDVTGNIDATGTITDVAGNTNHHSHP